MKRDKTRVDSMPAGYPRRSPAAVAVGRHRRFLVRRAAPPARATSRVIAVVVCALAAPAPGDDLALQPRPYEIPSYGLSIRAPVGVEQQSWPTGRTHMRFVGRQGYTIDLILRRGTEQQQKDMTLDPRLIMGPGADQFEWHIPDTGGDVTLERVQDLAIRHIGSVDPTAILFKQKELHPDGRTAAVIYFKRTPTILPFHEERGQARPWVLGQAFLELAPNVFAILLLRVDLETFDHARLGFEAMIHSIRLQDRQVLAKKRQAMLERGRMWLQLVDRDRLRTRVSGEQWYRLLHDGTDIGYMRIRGRDTQEMGATGLGIEIKARVARGPLVYDSDSRYFLSDDRHHEVWTIQTAARPAAPGQRPHDRANPLDVQTWAETGWRTRSIIEVKREGRRGIDQRRWERPSTGYLSQVGLLLMGPLLPHERAQNMAFYAYHSNTGRMTLHTIRVRPDRDGYRVLARPTLDHPEDVTYYDAQGRFLRREFHGGVLMKPATEQEMRLLSRVPSVP